MLNLKRFQAWLITHYTNLFVFDEIALQLQQNIAGVAIPLSIDNSATLRSPGSQAFL